MKKIFLLFFLFCIQGTAYSSQDNSKNDQIPASPPSSINELQEQLEKVLQDTHLPGMSVAIVQRDGPEWVAGLGKADLASGQNATAETLFRIGSTSKAFTSFAILQLVDQNRLSLEDKVHEIAPEVWFENRFEATSPVEVVHLLEHTTGWDDMHMREYAVDGSNMTLLDAFNYDHHSRISRWRPGTRTAYCNSGPAVAAYLVEKITKTRFENYIEEHLFKPIGMKTATYFKPTDQPATTLYHRDGKTPYPYWEVMYRPAGAINASANDMANYLLFHLNRGKVNGVQVMKEDVFARIITPTSTWAAKEGLKTGYGLGNYWTTYDGFVYHGHNGGVEGGVTELAYMPDEGVGYFFSINSSNGLAFEKIGTLIRAYITRNLEKLPIPPVASIPASAASYTGWYEPSSPRSKMFHFLELLFSLSHVRIEKDKLLISSLEGINALYLPVTATQFRHVPKNKASEPIPTLELLAVNDEGQFIQLNLGVTTMKRVPTWQAISQIIATGLCLLSIVAILAYAPFWILGGLFKKRRRPQERSIRLWPLISVLSLVFVIVVINLSSSDLIARLGNLTGWSFSLFAFTIIFAVASTASAIVLWRAPKQEIRKSVLAFSTIATLSLLISTAYLGYWGVIGLRTWA